MPRLIYVGERDVRIAYYAPGAILHDAQHRYGMAGFLSLLVRRARAAISSRARRFASILHANSGRA